MSRRSCAPPAANVALILVSHTHHDHVGAVPALQAGDRRAHSRASAISGSDSFDADIKLADGDMIAGMAAIHTPGHASDHLCFALPASNGTAVLFSADHVMSWSTSVVSPPGGDMADYFASLRPLLDRDGRCVPAGPRPAAAGAARPGARDADAPHGARAGDRSGKLAEGPAGTYALMDALYSQVHPRLRRAAERNVLAHLLKLERKARCMRDGEMWRAA